MSSSWNFPSWAQTSYKGSKPGQAGAFQFSSWNQTGIFSCMCSISSSKYIFLSCFYQFLNKNMSHFKIDIRKVVWKYKGKTKQKNMNSQAEMKSSSWREKATSQSELNQAEIPSARAMARASQFRLPTTISPYFCAKRYVYSGLHIEKKYQSVITLYQKVIWKYANS